MLQPGASLVFCTDGLIERRGASLQDGLEWLQGELVGRQEDDAEALCDHLLGQVADLEDDTALLIMRAFSEDRPRSAVAGRSVLPADLRARSTR